jgi:hypothetical protein
MIRFLLMFEFILQLKVECQWNQIDRRILLLTASANKHDEHHKRLQSHPCPKTRLYVKQIFEHYGYFSGKNEPIQIMKLKEAPNVKRVANVNMSFQ